jgi:hypothetical protein
MRAQLAVITEHFSERVTGERGVPVDLSERAIPETLGDPRAKRLIDAVAQAGREIRIRLRSTPAGGDAPLRLGGISTTEAGTGLEVETADLSLQDVDFTSEAGRADVLDALHKLERAFLA